MTDKKQKTQGEMTMPAGDFDAIMRQALGVAAPAAKQGKKPQGNAPSQPKK